MRHGPTLAAGPIEPERPRLEHEDARPRGNHLPTRARVERDALDRDDARRGEGERKHRLRHGPRQRQLVDGGAALMETPRNGLVLTDVSSFWQMIAWGVALPLALVIDQPRRGEGS